MTPYPDRHGYVRVYVGEDHPLADGSGHALMHHLVKASSGADGRRLKARIKAGAVVHHRNDRKSDNSRRNLQVVSRSKRTAEHNRKRAR